MLVVYCISEGRRFYIQNNILLHFLMFFVFCDVDIFPKMNTAYSVSHRDSRTMLFIAHRDLLTIFVRAKTPQNLLVFSTHVTLFVAFRIPGQRIFFLPRMVRGHFCDGHSSVNKRPDILA